MQSIGHAFAYSAWLGLDPKQFPIAAAQRSAQKRMVIALAIQITGIVLTAISVKSAERHHKLMIYIGLIPASFLPTWILIEVLAALH